MNHISYKGFSRIDREFVGEYNVYIPVAKDENENIWLTQRMMVTLYDVGLPTINEHIKKIYADS